MPATRRVLAAATALATLPLLASAPVGAAPTAPAPASTTVRTLPAKAATAPLHPANGHPRATIKRLEHDIPHIIATDWESLGFGHGYATAETTICTLVDVLLTARGERSRYLGADTTYDDQVSMTGTNLDVDTLVGDLHNRKVVEKLLADPVAGPGQEARAMVEGYAKGVNRYVAKVGGSSGVKDPACKGMPLDTKATALDMWYGIYTANILASTGVFLTSIVHADPPSLNHPGLPQVPGLPIDTSFQNVPDQIPGASKLLTSLGLDPDVPFGSNATAVGKDVTTTGRGMLLGNPHFPWRGRYRFTQAHLTIPGVYDVAGASLIGSPVINIGWNKDVAWSHTVSTAYRFTPYEYKTLISPKVYLTDHGIKKLEHRTVKVAAKQKDGQIATLTQDLYRTPQGYVIDDVSKLMGWSPVSFFAIRDANAEQLRTIDSFLEMGKATTVRDLIDKQDAGGGIPWVNTIAADRNGDVVYADHSVVPHVSNAMARRCLTPIGYLMYKQVGLPGLDGTRADSSCAWGADKDAERPGILGPDNLPEAFRTDWVMNANDSYWLPNPAQKLEGYPRIIGCEKCERTLRSRMVYHYVLDRLSGADGLAGNKVSPSTFAATEHADRVYGAELARENGDLDKVCRAAVAKGADPKACVALQEWDGTSKITSRGGQIFTEFWKRLPAKYVWEVPFSADDPVETPRDLNETNAKVVKAMVEAIAYLKAKKVPWNAQWGTLNVAGDRGAPPIPVDGGDAGVGNANATVSRNPDRNSGYLYPVTYGSSHIQSIAFTDKGVEARTILTYSQNDNPKLPTSSDQTRMFGKGRWVSFPWTAAQDKQQLVRSFTVTG